MASNKFLPTLWILSKNETETTIEVNIISTSKDEEILRQRIKEDWDQGIYADVKGVPGYGHFCVRGRCYRADGDSDQQIAEDHERWLEGRETTRILHLCMIINPDVVNKGSLLSEVAASRNLRQQRDTIQAYVSAINEPSVSNMMEEIIESWGNYEGAQ